MKQIDWLHDTTIKPDEIMIPDLWHLAMWLRDVDGVRSSRLKLPKHISAILYNDGENVLKCWHAAHQMKKVLCALPDSAVQEEKAPPVPPDGAVLAETRAPDMRGTTLEEQESILVFVKEAAKAFNKDKHAATFGGVTTAGTLLALRWGLFMDCILVVRTDTDFQPLNFHQACERGC